jgi:hypothetical protein
MATKKQKEELIEALKAEPATYEIILSGYGGEIVLGRVNKEQYEFWSERDDFDEHCNDWDNELEVPEEMQVVRDGSWHDCDDLAHECGAEFSSLNYVSVVNKATGETVFECPLDYDELEKHGIDPEGIASEEYYISADSDAEYAFLGQSVEKGTFFTGEIEILGKFDPRCLSFSYIDVEGWQIVNGVSYKSEIVDDTGGYDTTGKSLDFKIFQVER